MAFPEVCVGPICGAFLRRSSTLLSAPEPDIPKIQYSVLTLKLLAEKNKYALHHMTLDVSGESSLFLKSAFGFMLNDFNLRDETLEITSLLSFIIMAILNHSSIEATMFSNKAVFREILTSLKLLLTKDILRKVPSSITRLSLQILYRVSSSCSVSLADLKQSTVVLLQDLVHTLVLTPLDRALTKAILIQISLPTSLQEDQAVLITSEEVLALLDACTLRHQNNYNSTIQVLEWLKCLALHPGNKQALLDHDVLEFLAPLVDETDTQEVAAELLYSFINSSGEEVVIKVAACSDDLSDPGRCDVVEDCSHDLSDTVTALLPCAIICFKRFSAACGEHSQSDASLNLMYTSTLINMIFDVLRQEGDHTQTLMADSMATVPGGPETFIHMLWGSSIVLPLDFSQLPSPMWISTFFEIHNCLVLCTHASEDFCLSLANAGLLHFMECELTRLGKELPNIEKEENQILKAQLLSVLTVLYNCVQKKKCLQVLLSTHTLGDSLVPIASIPNLEIRFLSKLIVILFFPILVPEQCSTLMLQPDEVSFILESLMKESSDDQGFPTSELLQGLLNLTAVEENALICFSPAFLKCFEDFLSSSSQLYLPLILEIIWNLLIAARRHTREDQIKAMVPILALLPAVSFEMKTIYCCISFLLHQNEINPLELLAYASGCFKYQKYEECMASADQVISLSVSSRSTANGAKLLKGKALYFCYQHKQEIFLKRRGVEPVKDIERMKKECYEGAREAILLLGSALDHDFIDEEGSQLLDCAMIDYLRETSSLSSCQRCFLCRKKTKVRRSHLFPKSILKGIATDLITKEEDHKVFATMIGKLVKKSAGEATFGMLCSNCEQCLSQNGEDQFMKSVRNRIYVGREVVQSSVKMAYGSWFYDFCIGLLFRSFAVCHPSEIFTRASGKEIFKMLADCRRYLLSLQTNVPSLMKEPKTPLLPPSKSIEFFFFVNPAIKVSSCRLPNCPAIFINPVHLSDGIFSHTKEPSLILIHFDHMNILVQLKGAPPSALQNAVVKPHGGEIDIPYEHQRWKSLPTGVWKLFSAITQGSRNLNRIRARSSDRESAAQTAKSLEQLSLVYAPENIISLSDFSVFSFLPGCHGYRTDSDTKKVVVQFPAGHSIFIHVTQKWAHEQEMVVYVAESSSELYLVFVLSLPGWCILDGLCLDAYDSTVSLPFLNYEKEEKHPLKVPVIQALVEPFLEIKNYLLVRPQLS